jgi:hypothetical protein
MISEQTLSHEWITTYAGLMLPIHAISGNILSLKVTGLTLF